MNMQVTNQIEQEKSIELGEVRWKKEIKRQKGSISNVPIILLMCSTMQGVTFSVKTGAMFSSFQWTLGITRVLMCPKI